MGLEDLREQGVLLPEKRWGKHELTSTVARWWLLSALVAAAGGVGTALVGDGGPLTWVGVGVFLVALSTATILCDRAVTKQRRRMEEGRR